MKAETATAMDPAAKLAALRAQIEAVQSPMDGTLRNLLGHLVACHRELELRRAYERALEGELAERDARLAKHEAAATAAAPAETP